MNIQLLKDLCMLYGPSGRETAVADFILAEIKDYIDDYEIDALGNLIAHKKGPGKKMMLAGHMDQIGLIVTGIDKNGFLYFSNLGGQNPDRCLTQRVIFPNGTTGTINAERLEDKKEIGMDKLYIDIGAMDEAHAHELVSVGDACVFLSEAYSDEYKIISPALDDRVGCFVMIEALKLLKNSAFDIYLSFTVQEEVGLRGARTAAYKLDPDYGVAFDVTLSYDTPGALKFPSKMYGGAAIKLKDASLLCHPAIIKHMERCAKEAGVKYQFEILTAGGTDSGAIHVSKNGVPSGCISVPTRYVHSVSEMCALSDIKDCIALTVKVLETEI